MYQLRHNSDFTLKALGADGIGHPFGEDLYRDIATEVVVMGTIDDRHSPAPDFAVDFKSFGKWDGKCGCHASDLTQQVAKTYVRERSSDSCTPADRVLARTTPAISCSRELPNSSSQCSLPLLALADRSCARRHRLRVSSANEQHQ